MTQPILYTVGHSNQTFEDLLGMLQAQHINVIVDVRSVPASKYTPQFNQQPLQAALQREHVHYLHFGNEFGARRTDALDADNMVDFEKAVQTPAFLEGVKRLMDGLHKGYRISLMWLSDYRAGKVEWPEYERIFADLMTKRRINQRYKVADFDNCCFLCSEETPEHCHRRLLAEYLQHQDPDNVKIVHLV